jgi:NAD(P)-dependent dehydrogenase (short-subunit alcohol dehydrogenase family)
MGWVERRRSRFWMTATKWCCTPARPNALQALPRLTSCSAGIVVGDLRSAADTRSIADQVNASGRMDAVIHNAGVYTQRSRSSTPEGHAGTLAVNTLAPYMLTALIQQRSAPRRGGFAGRP